jgi:phage-related baseplate assembly protein
MAISIKDLVKDLTKEELLDALLAALSAAGLPVTAWQPGEPILALLDRLSELFARLWNSTIVKAIRAGFLDFAEGEWLTLLAWVTYGVVRKTSTFAGSPLVVENRAGGVWTFVPGDIRTKNADGKTFTNVTGGAIAAFTGAGDFPTVTLDFVADEAGSDSNTPSGGIQAFPTPPVTAPTGIYVRTNVDPLFADDEEEDEPLKRRCRLSTGPLSPAGPKASYESIALSTKRADGTSVDVTRVRVLQPGGGVVNVVLAGASGAATGNTSTPGTDVYLVNQRVQVLCVPPGITCNVASAVEKAVAVALDLRVDRAANLSAAAAATAARDASALYFRRLPVGGHKVADGGPGYVLVSEVQAKASEAADGIIKATMAGTDVELAVNEVAVPAITTTATLVTQ